MDTDKTSQKSPTHSLKVLERYSVAKMAHWLVWTLVILSTLTTLALWASLDAKYGKMLLSMDGPDVLLILNIWKC